jgi:hypothetical protein
MRGVMRCGLLALILASSSAVPAQAEIGDHTGGTDAGAVVVGGTPIAIAVVAPSGTLASYRRAGARAGPRWTCGYYQFTNGSTSSISIDIDRRSGPVQPVAGEGYAFFCYDDRGDLVHSWFGVYQPADPFAGLFAAERAAELALERLELPDPLVRFNPPDDQIVGLPSWLWVDQPWVAADVSASVSAVTSTVVATPVMVTWDMGDGSRVMCAGPGTPYDVTRSRGSQVSDCSHTYQNPSHARAGGVYEVTATVVYAVSWIATNGRDGDLGTVTRASTVPVRVVEVQAVID